MPAKILDGTAISRQILDELRAEVGEIVKKTGKAPGLVTILVGQPRFRKVMWPARFKTAGKVLVFTRSRSILPEETTEAELHALD